MRRAHYEIFWYNHHWLVVFWGCLLFHGPVFKYWFALPGALYATERLLRVLRSRRVVYLRKVNWIPPYVGAGTPRLSGKVTRPRTRSVLELQLEPSRHADLAFTEGMFVSVCCPSVVCPRGARPAWRMAARVNAPARQWHPLSISSASGDLERHGFVSLHIKVRGAPHASTRQGAD